MEKARIVGHVDLIVSKIKNNNSFRPSRAKRKLPDWKKPCKVSFGALLRKAYRSKGIYI